MNTEEIEFSGWTYDSQTEKDYTPIILGKVVRATFYSCFGLLIAAGIFKSITDISMPRWFVLTGFAGMAASVALAFIYKSLSEKAPKCTCCGKSMALITTLPSQTECEERGYIQGTSGHAYQKGDDVVYEVRKHWYGCDACKRYVLTDGQVTEIIDGVEERETDYTTADKTIKAIVERRKRLRTTANQRGHGTH